MRHCSKCGGISTLAIVLCSIAVLLVVAFVVIKIAQNCKPKYRIVNQIQVTQTATSKTETLKQDNDLKEKTKNDSVNKHFSNKNNEPPFISGLSKYNLYDINGGCYVYDSKQIGVSISHKNCIITNRNGESDCFSLDFSTSEDRIDFLSKKIKYVVGQHDFNKDGIDELVIGVCSPNKSAEFEGDVVAIVVYRINDNKKWKFGCLFVNCGVHVSITNNVIDIPWNCRGFSYEYTFRNDNFYEVSDYEDTTIIED